MSHTDPVFVNEFGEALELLRKVCHGRLSPAALSTLLSVIFLVRP